MTEIVMYLKFAGLLLGFCALFLPSIQDIFKESRALQPKGIVTIVVAILIVLISMNEIYQEERKLTPDDMKFTMTYYCTGLDKTTQEDIFRFCPKSFYATLENPQRPLTFVFNRIDKVERITRRTGGSQYYVIYES